MRGSLVFCLLTLLGCQSARIPAPGGGGTGEIDAHLPGRRFVTLPRLADDLDLAYRGDAPGYIELSAPPDHVMLVRDSTRVLVNGHSYALGYPCVRRGEEYVITRGDADRVRQLLGRARVTRAAAESESVRTVPRPPSLTIRPRSSARLPAAWRPNSGVRPRSWRYIVIHHMASSHGSAAIIHRQHRKRGYDGLGYHFVIGNGSVTRDGEIEVGYRWRRQTHGAHARRRQGRGDNKYNERGIGVCLVGDFTGARPSRRQMDALTRLVNTLRAEYGIPKSEARILPHRNIKPTLCPGPKFPWADFWARLD